jgi:hypothetical protein
MILVKADKHSQADAPARTAGGDYEPQRAPETFQ